jgi:hypothetical protein
LLIRFVGSLEDDAVVGGVVTQASGSGGHQAGSAGQSAKVSAARTASATATGRAATATLVSSAATAEQEEPR